MPVFTSLLRAFSTTLDDTVYTHIHFFFNLDKKIGLSTYALFTTCTEHMPVMNKEKCFMLKHLRRQILTNMPRNESM